MSAILEFSRRWSPFGGCDEQIIPEFSLAVPMFYRRVLALLKSKEPPSISEGEWIDLIMFCDRKIREQGYQALPPRGTRTIAISDEHSIRKQRIHRRDQSTTMARKTTSESRRRSLLSNRGDKQLFAAISGRLVGGLVVQQAPITRTYPQASIRIARRCRAPHERARR